MGGYIIARLNSQDNGIIIADLLYLKRKTLIYYVVVCTHTFTRWSIPQFDCKILRDNRQHIGCDLFKTVNILIYLKVNARLILGMPNSCLFIKLISH